MQMEKLLQIRRSKGQEIAQTGKVKMEGHKWLVPSQSSNKQYEVMLGLGNSKCNCPDNIERGIKCKHIFAVEIVITKSMDKEGNTTITATKRITYPQDWANYTKAQTQEGRLFKELLKELVENVAEKEQVMGRPRVPLKEALFCAIEKVYSMQSSRRAYSLYKEAEQRSQIGKAPSYNVVNITLNDKELTPILRNLLSITALPLKSVETKFAVDSTGFRTTKFNEYCKDKHNTKKEHSWVKCHAIVGTKTNIVASATITDEWGADSPQFIPLIEDTAKMGFELGEITADKAYSSKINHDAVRGVGGTPFIPFKSNAIARSHGRLGSAMWRKMYHYFMLNKDEFMEHYHLRSNVESTFMAIKSKFGDCLKNKNIVSQTNELLCKLIAYNISVLISAMYELKIEPQLMQS